MEIDFDHLPRAVRERWVEASRHPENFGGREANDFGMGPELAKLGYGLLAVGGIILFVVFAHDTLWRTWVDTAASAGAALAGITGLLLMLPLRRVTWGEAYVFPGCIVFRNGRRLDVVPFDKMPEVPTEVTIRGGRYSGSKHVRLVLSGWRWVLYPGKTEEAIFKYNFDRRSYARALAAGDTAALMAANPFYEGCHRGQWKAERAEPGGPRLGGLSVWPARAVAFLLAPALAVPPVVYWHLRAVAARDAREQALEHDKVAWMDPILAKAASPAADALLREICTHHGADVSVHAPDLPAEALRKLDDAARAERALPPSEALRADWETKAFIEVASPPFKAVFTGWDTDHDKGAGISFSDSVPIGKGEIIHVNLEATVAGPAIAVQSSGGAGGTRLGGAKPAAARAAGRCLPLAFRGTLVVDELGPQLRIPVDIAAMSSDAISRDIDLEVDHGSARSAPALCYDVQVRHAFREAGRAFVRTIFRDAPTSMSTM